ncbi:phosphoribosyltransferase-like protein [Xylariomycetidae sp. FL2044]|nr:phosphoribosyltransferase-like protein [Xylariomycetidae sp. FL2044]
MYEIFTGKAVQTAATTLENLRRILGPECSTKSIDGIGLLDTEMHMSRMDGGHGGGKTSPFKRRLFLKNIRDKHTVAICVSALQTRPSEFCYLHLLPGGGKVSDTAAGATALRYRDWDFACVITGIWVSVFAAIRNPKNIQARVVSISVETKREYALATGADLDSLLENRAYKERYRSALTAFFEAQVRKRPKLPEEHSMRVVYGAKDVSVLLITGMRDETPVPNFSHLFFQTADWLTFAPIFDNDSAGDEAGRQSAGRYLTPLVHEDLQRLYDMIPQVYGFQRAGIEFRHVLDVARRPGGLSLSASLFRAHFAGDWAKVGAVTCHKAGGSVFASALAAKVGKPLVLVRQASILPPPTISANKPPSHISVIASKNAGQERFDKETNSLSRGASVVVVDDVLATGKPLLAVLQLLVEAGINTRSIKVMVVGEFSLHRGRDLLRQYHFGNVGVQSLLIFGGA